MNEITVDYAVLKKQIQLLYSYRSYGRNELFDGVIELLAEILAQKPFKEGSD